jgi:hypothetical protein
MEKEKKRVVAMLGVKEDPEFFLRLCCSQIDHF